MTNDSRVCKLLWKEKQSRSKQAEEDLEAMNFCQSTNTLMVLECNTLAVSFVIYIAHTCFQWEFSTLSLLDPLLMI